MRMNHSSTDLTDAVVGHARAGDQVAMRQVYDTLGPRLVGYARSQGVDDPDVVANETLFRVLSGLDEFSGTIRALRSWAFTIAHNLIIDEHRRRARRPLPSDAGDLASLAAPVDVELVVSARVDIDRTLAAIDELSPDQRDVLLLRHVADLSLVETAAVVGKRVNAVKQLQHRATKALAKRLADAPVTRDSQSTFTRVS